MTREYFITEFERHLRVAEPKWGEIIAELKTHIDELPDDNQPAIALGDPKQLAARYNRTHVGWLTEFRMALLIIVATFVPLFIHQYFIDILRTRYLTFNEASASSYFLFTLSGNLGMVFPLILAVWIGLTIQRMHRPIQALFRITAIALLCSIAASIISGFDGWLFYTELPIVFRVPFSGQLLNSLLIGFFRLVPYFIMCTLSAVLFGTVPGDHKKQRSFLKFQLLIATFFVMVAYIVTAYFMSSIESFASFRQMNASGAFQVLITSSIIAFFAVRFTRRFRRLRE